MNITDIIGTPDIEVSLDQKSIQNLAIAMVLVIIIALGLWVIARKIVK